MNSTHSLLSFPSWSSLSLSSNLSTSSSLNGQLTTQVAGIAPTTTIFQSNEPSGHQINLYKNYLQLELMQQQHQQQLDAFNLEQQNLSSLRHANPISRPRAITGSSGNYKTNKMSTKSSNIALHKTSNLNHFYQCSMLASASPTAKYSRKVFIGGLPPDIDENEVVAQFRRFGSLNVDWPHKSESKSTFPPKGYAFLIFDKEYSVQELMNNCVVDKEKYYICISSPSIKDKPVQIRPWCLSDSDFVLDNTQPIDPRRTIFVGGVPRPLKSYELATIMNKLYGGVCFAGIDIDPELKYPKGAGRVSFSNQQSYVNAISSRFIQLKYNEIDKRAEIKPYVLDDQACDMCKGFKCGGKNAQYFCANVTCLQYYCDSCWSSYHAKPGKDFHKPLIKEANDRPKTIPFRWC